MLENLYKNKQKNLQKSQNIFLNSNSLIPKIGIELEFFLLEKNLQPIQNSIFLTDFISELKKEILNNFSLIYQIEKEQGISQIEIKTIFTDDLFKLAFEIENVRNFVKNFAQRKQLIASFAAQPFIEDCGNAMQFNISLHDKNDLNLFEKNQKIINQVIFGLLEKTNEMMLFLAPHEEDYQRFSVELNKNLFKKGKFSAPINLSYGGDNRTCAIRIPSFNFLQRKTTNGKRLEYRVASASCDPFLVISAILSAIDYGMKSDLELENSGFKQVFGNAFDDQYQAEALISSLDQAKSNFDKESFFSKIFI